jgi:predicted nucleic acid-binding protein
MIERKMELYLETSVPNAYLDATKPERQQETQAFWHRLNHYHVYISDFVLKEIRQTPQATYKEELLDLVKPFDVLRSEGEEIRALTQLYVQGGAITIVADAFHVAIAVIYKIGILASWNYRHLVKLKTKHAVNAVNLTHGYNTIEIVDPSML